MPIATDDSTSDHEMKRSMTMPGREGLGKNVWEAALERMDRVYDQFDHVAVAFSGGKDSTAVLHVTLEVAAAKGKLPVRVLFWDEEAIPYETEDYVRRVAERDDVDLTWLCLPIQHRNACSNAEPYWWCWAPESEHLWVRPMPPEGIREWPGFPIWPQSARYYTPEMNGLLFTPEMGRAAFVFGIRADESIRRLQAVTRRLEDNWIVALDRATTPTLRSSVSKVYPVFDWTAHDVWTAPQILGWDYNRGYDHQELAGIGSSRQRCAPPFAEEPMQKLWMWKVCYPDLWEKMCARVPGAATAARYGTTELYEFRGTTPKPAELSWQEYLTNLLERFGDAARPAAVANIKKLIYNHYAKTTDPILPFARHPVSGVSWQELAKIAKRGDLRNRRSLILGMDEGKLARFQVEYDAERAEIETALGVRLTPDNCGHLL